MSQDRTKQSFRRFERERNRRGQGGVLVLITRDGTTAPYGYAPTRTITAGWYGKRVTRHALGAEFFEVKVAEYNEMGPDLSTDLTNVFDGEISHLKIDDRYYKFISVEEPKRATRVWLIRCAPTAERTPTS